MSEEGQRRRSNMEKTLDRLRAGDGETPRERLIVQLATVCGGDDARARDFVDALDAYLDEGADRVPALVYRSTSTDDLIAERDAAIDRATRAEQELRELRAKNGTHGPASEATEPEDGLG